MLIKFINILFITVLFSACATASVNTAEARIAAMMLEANKRAVPEGTVPDWVLKEHADCVGSLFFKITEKIKCALPADKVITESLQQCTDGLPDTAVFMLASQFCSKFAQLQEISE